MPYNPFIIVEVFQSDATTLIAEVPRRWDVQGNDPLNVAGTCQVTLIRSDDIFTRHPTLLDMGNWVRYTLCDGVGGQKIVALMAIRNITTKFVGSAEEGDFVTTVSGPTLHGILADFIIKHVTQPPRNDAPSTRFYGWASPVDEWFELSSWDDTPESMGEWRDHITDARSGTTAKPSRKPKHWPDKLAEWVRVAGFDWQFYRDVVTIPSGGATIRWFLTADEVVLGFIDGDAVISRDEDESGYKSFGEYKAFLTAGDHQLAVMMRKKGTPGGDGVDAWLGTMYTVDASGDLDTLVKRSNTTWNVHAGLPAPGWRQAEILRSIVLEAQARGNDSANLLTLNFSGNLDSNGDPWVTEYNRAFSIGATALDAQAQLSEWGDFDVFVDPGTLKINAYLRRGTDKSANIALDAGRNLIDWEVTHTDEVANKALVSYEGGWLERTNSASVTEFGEREVGISLGSVSDDETASAISDSHLETRKEARKRAGAADEWHVDEDRQAVASIVPALGCTPFIDFQTGDSIKAPSHTGVHKRQRLVSLAFAEENETGLISFDPEFAEDE